MSRKHVSRQKVSVEQDDEQDAVAEEPELRATVELEMQAKIDSDVREQIAAAGDLGRPRGMTLEEQENWEARELEIRRTRERDDSRQSSRREELCRAMTAAKHCGVSSEPDPREALNGETRGTVRRQAERLFEKSRGGLGFEAIERELAARVVSGQELRAAVLDMAENLEVAPGTMVALDALDAVGRKWVDVEARLVELWEPNAASIQQVGLLEDDTGRTKLTVWKRSNQPLIAEGDRVRIRDAAVSWYRGRPSLALTGRSMVFFPERDAWWE